MIRLKTLRADNGISQQALASAIGVSRSTIAMWETGASQPDNDFLKALANYFNVSIDYLLERTDTPNENKKSDEEPDVLMTEQFATFGDAREYSEDEKDEIRNFINFIKAKRRKEK